MTNAFADLGLSAPIVKALADLGYEEPTPIQKAAIPVLLAGRDVLGQAATGTGKTAAFGLPLVERYVAGHAAGVPCVLVLTPTRELCLQVCESFLGFGKDVGIEVAPIYGGQEYGRQIRLLKRGVHVVVATPGRALDHLRRGTLNLSGIKALVLDEADEMLDMGFADELEAILAELPEEHQTALFSATLPTRIQSIAEAHLKDPEHIVIARSATQGEAPRIPQTAYVVGRPYRLAALGRILALGAQVLLVGHAADARVRGDPPGLLDGHHGIPVGGVHPHLEWQTPVTDCLPQKDIHRGGQGEPQLAEKLLALPLDILVDAKTHIHCFRHDIQYIVLPFQHIAMNITQLHFRIYEGISVHARHKTNLYGKAVRS